MNRNKLNPNWVTGFVDGEGCFMVAISKYKTNNIRWQVKPRFQFSVFR